LTQDGPFICLHHRYAPTPLDGVFQARLEPETADQAIAAVMNRFRQEGRSLLWLTGDPKDLPDLPARLQAHGFVPDHAIPGMAADLDLLPEDEPLPIGLRIESVRDDAAHQTLAAIQVQTLGEAFGPRVALKRAFGLAAEGPVQHYLGYLNGQAVAAATAICGAGVLSLWGIGTLPAYQGRGIGRAMTLHACLHGRRRGYQVVTLYATPSGLPVYRKLGFETYGQMQFFHCR
jgi:ribosomal protein S18 acetylase RimI-like enzyme